MNKRIDWAAKGKVQFMNNWLHFKQNWCLSFSHCIWIEIFRIIWLSSSSLTWMARFACCCQGCFDFSTVPKSEIKHVMYFSVEINATNTYFTSVEVRVGGGKKVLTLQGYDSCSALVQKKCFHVSPGQTFKTSARIAFKKCWCFTTAGKMGFTVCTNSQTVPLHLQKLP